MPSILHKNWNLIQKDQTLSKLFPSTPVTAYRRPNSLRDILVKANIKKKSNPSPGGYTRCNRTNCLCCKAELTERTFQSTATQEKFTIYLNFSCKTKNCIYLLTCGVCKIQYVGQTITTFNMRLNNHRSWCRTGKNCPVTRHVKSKGHPFDSFKFQIIDQSEELSSDTLDQRENFWIHQLCTLEPGGLNERDENKIKKKTTS